MESIHIVTASNDDYAKQLAVMLNSLLKNKVSENPINIHIIDSNISKKNKKKLKNFITKFNLKINFLKVDSSIYRRCKVSGHLTKETFYRYSIPNLLDKNIKKAIYLDCDVIIKDDITKLWNENIEEYCLAAVQVPEKFVYWVRDPLIPRNSYFNNGVMLMNLEMWRKKDIGNKVIKYIRKNRWRTPAPGQDGGNAILHDKWLRLDPKWNHFAVLTGLVDINPSIIHYAGKVKPWNNKRCPLKEEYFKYLRTTKWD